jgi:hypothetical protein
MTLPTPQDADLPGGPTPPIEDSSRDAYQPDLARVARERVREVLLSALKFLEDDASLVNAAEVRPTRPTRATRVREELRLTLDVYAKTMRALGEPADRVIVTVKSVVDAAVAELVDEGEQSLLTGDTELRDDVLRWTVDSYWGAAASH